MRRQGRDLGGDGRRRARGIYAELRGSRTAQCCSTIFGLLRPYHGLGLGGALLTHALRRGLELGDRVWVRTNTSDGPHALANYQARGMRVYRSERRG